jgi:predicted enzyme related to lactoylglutathione lyase
MSRLNPIRRRVIVMSENVLVGQQGIYCLLSRGEEMTAGCMGIRAPALADGARPHWLYCILVDDVERKAAKAKDLVGEVVCRSLDITGLGRFCVIRDPQGGVLALFAGAAGLLLFINPVQASSLASRGERTLLP